ncbi:bifunctional (p)ppGpp synthetase/guanosine-3',5'-bis(diphosphate) 3'-pyrophosphohydrolase [Candidatus Kaiserbacteria bacterium]|nr:bifunctional (p)ppGpp synthetase/guanosine-3',5'-bis(diphosphate) 3'-pyrophosphohydrolase [Candidatus Kaiserbacteria bacterium]
MAAVKSLKEILTESVAKNEKDQHMITEAYEFARIAHEKHERYSGEPYFIHVAEVGYQLARSGMDAQAVSAGLLHDTIEDAGVSEDTMREKFGEEVLALVDGVTKLGALRYQGLERHAESLRKLFAATAKDIRVLIIKLMDRLHNAQTLSHVPEQKRKRIALETLEIYAPIADRLGMSVVKSDLEDAAFPYAYPPEYERVRALLRERHAETERRLEKTERHLKKALAEAGIRSFRMETRKKGVYSLYRKLERKKWDITQIHDIIALRVIVENVADCYTIMGIVHGEWRPVPGKIKDYIASPKPNGYQSIHTTIYTGDGGTLEIQVRTEAMHREAQFGIASHLSYKVASGYGGGTKSAGIEWMRQLMPGRLPQKVKEREAGKLRYGIANIPRWIKELAEAREVSENSEEYLEDIKTDFFSYRVFVLTPKGDVIDLPADATPIDFAYAIHSEIGDHMAGAKVNGKLVSLDTKLHNGDIVEITTKKTSKPSKKWLDFAKTTMAKKHIRAAIGG